MAESVLVRLNFFLRRISVKLLRKKVNATPNNLSSISCGSNVEFGQNSNIFNCEFGDNNRIGAYSYLSNVLYGNYSYNAQRTTIINCKLGKFCSIAQGVSIGLGKHPVNEFVSTHPSFYSIHKQCGYTFADKSYFDEMGHVEIGNDVWIGANSIIFDDVTIGNGAIIAANSLVNNNVPAYAIVGGSPAKIIRYRFSPDQIEFLEKFRWWNKGDEWLKLNFKVLHNINALMENTIDGNH